MKKKFHTTFKQYFLKNFRYLRTAIWTAEAFLKARSTLDVKSWANERFLFDTEIRCTAELAYKLPVGHLVNIRSYAKDFMLSLDRSQALNEIQYYRNIIDNRLCQKIILDSFFRQHLVKG